MHEMTTDTAIPTLTYHKTALYGCTSAEHALARVLPGAYVIGERENVFLPASTAVGILPPSTARDRLQSALSRARENGCLWVILDDIGAVPLEER